MRQFLLPLLIYCIIVWRKTQKLIDFVSLTRFLINCLSVMFLSLPRHHYYIRKLSSSKYFRDPSTQTLSTYIIYNLNTNKPERFSESGSKLSLKKSVPSFSEIKSVICKSLFFSQKMWVAGFHCLDCYRQLSYN